MWNYKWNKLCKLLLLNVVNKIHIGWHKKILWLKWPIYIYKLLEKDIFQMYVHRYCFIFKIFNIYNVYTYICNIYRNTNLLLHPDKTRLTPSGPDRLIHNKYCWENSGKSCCMAAIQTAKFELLDPRIYIS